MSIISNNCYEKERLIIENYNKYCTLISDRSAERKILEDQIATKIYEITNLPFKSSSKEFYEFLKKNNDKIVKDIAAHGRCENFQPFFLVESHLRDKTSESLEKIEAYLIKVRKEDFDPAGIETLRSALADGVVVRNVYRSEDEILINLFMRYLPQPRIELFKKDGGPIPDCIMQEAKKADATIQAFAEKHGMQTVEKSAIILQRAVRGRQKRKKELIRVMQINKWDEIKAKQMIHSGNTPYLPKCNDDNLAARIFNAAYQVPIYPSIRHVAAAKALPKILDECLYGRQSLCNNYQSFRPAALFSGDKENGDTNAICFGPQRIDPRAYGIESVEIVLDMEKFKENRFERRNPCIFFNSVLDKK